MASAIKPDEDRLHPLKTHVALHVGVTGHRPQKLQRANSAELRDKVSRVLNRLRACTDKIASATETLYAPGPPLLRVISSLAEGADRLVAHAALAVGYELHSCLPFDRNEYENDFQTSESRDEFRTLLEKSTAVFELDGCRDRRPKSYESASNVVLAQSDVLIAIWDGEEVVDRGGTAQTIKHALHNGIPVVVIDAKAPHLSHLLVSNGNEEPTQTKLEELDERISSLLRPTLPEKLANAYFSEQLPSSFGKRFWSNSWRIFRALCADTRIGTNRSRTRNGELAETRYDWQSVSQQIRANADNFERLAAHYEWADLLAVHYADRYRASYLYCYLSAAAAAAAGATTALFHSYKGIAVACGVVELLLMGLVVFLIWSGKRLQLHGRYIDYRLLAQQLVVLPYLVLLGRSLPRLRLPLHQAGRYASIDWVQWHARSVAREFGLVDAKIDPSYLQSYRQALAHHELSAQVDYHAQKSQQYECLNDRLHYLGVCFFYTAIVTAALHLIPRGLTDHSQLAAVATPLGYLATLLPALGAACYAIRNHGEFERIAERSNAICCRLRQLAQHGCMTGETVPTWSMLGKVAFELADLMVNDAADWRVLLRIRVLSEP